MIRDKKKLREFLLALFITVISSVILLNSVKKINSGNTHIELLKLGAHNSYCIKYKKNPIARIEILHLPGEIDGIIYKGIIATDSETPLALQGQTTFNALGQLFNSNFSLLDSHNEFEAEFSLNGAKNTQIKFEIQNKGLSIFKKELSVEGPLLFLEKSEGKLALLAPLNSTSISQTLGTLRNSINSNATLEIDMYSEIQSNESLCEIKSLPTELKLKRFANPEELQKIIQLLNQSTEQAK